MQITEAEVKLRHPMTDEIASGLAWLMKVGMAYPTTIPPGEEVAAYVAVLSNVPSCGLKKALTKLRNGEYENIERAFIPRPPELAAMARAEAKMERDDLVRLRDTKRTLDERSQETAKVSEEGKARIRKMLEEYRASHRLAKEAERGNVVPEVTPERIDMLTRIMALPDAKEITAEQMANRRAASKLIEQNTANAEDAA